MKDQVLKFPIGKCPYEKNPSEAELNQWITDIENFPSALLEICDNLDSNQKAWRYRPGGWMLKQVVHHCADSHINAFVRFKLALTEEKPVIKPYEESKWAELIDSMSDDLMSSLLILKGVHDRWVILLKSLNSDDLRKEFIHPEHGRIFTLIETIGSYAWHSNHHLAHVKNALKHKF